MLNAFEENLGKILVRQGLISEANLAKALEEQNKQGAHRKPFGSFLTEKEYVSEKDLLKALGIQFNLPVMELKEIVIDPAVLRLVPEAMARRFKVIPLYLVEKELSVAMADPTNIYGIDALTNQTRCQIQPVLALERDIMAALEYNYKSQSRPGEDSVTGTESKRLEEAGKEISIVRTVDGVFLRAIQEGASDIHVEPGKDKLSVRLRVDGILKEYYTFTPKDQLSIISRLKIMSQLDFSERHKPQDGRFKLEMGGKEMDVRVSTLPTYYGEKVVLRLLDQQKIQLNLEDLGMSSHNLALLKTMISQPYGLMLVTGPTGSGKSTTLYTALSAIKSEEKNIVTVEDPVEYQIPLINQVQVNPKKDLTFATALRSVLRQDPNVIMIGEIRDPESGQIATEAALTGHLVFSTLHTNDAIGAVVRLVEMGIEPFLLAPSLLGIVAQRLTRKICPECMENYTPRKAELDRLGIPEATTGIKFSRGKGCPACKGSGYRGRIAIHEILMVDATIRTLITERAATGVIREHAVQSGFIDMRLDGIRKLIKGMTTLEEVLRVTKGL
ncbi:MAG: Flp pilus assembly complex ATPase component TadA [Nitrospirae bacterium]|nr:Flp pilus assembly complex ATPase component TadA [Nitrospirota bacterium]